MNYKFWPQQFEIQTIDKIKQTNYDVIKVDSLFERKVAHNFSRFKPIYLTKIL